MFAYIAYVKYRPMFVMARAIVKIQKMETKTSGDDSRLFLTF